MALEIPAMAGLGSYRCSRCSFCCLAWREFYRHNFETHSNELGFVMRCVVVGCSQSFRCYSSFSSHLSRKHRGVDFESEARVMALSHSFLAQQEEPTHSDVDAPMVQEEGFSNLNETIDDPQVIVSGDSSRLFRFAALFLLNAKERYQLTQSSLDFITQQIQQMIYFVVDDIAEIVTEHLSNEGVSEISSFTEQLDSYRNPFIHLQTEYMQNKFYQENFKLVVSAQSTCINVLYVLLHILSQEPVTIHLGGPLSNDSFQYVPLLQGLQQLLQHAEVFDEVCLKVY